MTKVYAVSYSHYDHWVDENKLYSDVHKANERCDELNASDEQQGRIQKYVVEEYYLDE
jgi:hypothetical protein